MVWANGAGSTRRWRNVRAEVIARDAAKAAAAGEPNCALQLPGVCTGDLGRRHVHHVLGADGPDPYDPAHLTTTCEACNLATGDPRKQQREPAAPVPDWLQALADGKAT